MKWDPLFCKGPSRLVRLEGKSHGGGAPLTWKVRGPWTISMWARYWVDKNTCLNCLLQFDIRLHIFFRWVETQSPTINWVFPKIVVPQIINCNRVFPYKPSILGYPYFWKHPTNGKLLVWVGDLRDIPTPNPKPVGDRKIHRPTLARPASTLPSSKAQRLWKGDV